MMSSDRIAYFSAITGGVEMNSLGWLLGDDRGFFKAISEFLRIRWDSPDV